MATPLTRHDKTGRPYVRPPDVEAAIQAALPLAPAELRVRAKVRNPHAAGFLPLECLVHVVREAGRRGDRVAQNIVIAILFQRAEAIVMNRLRNHPDPTSVCEAVLTKLAEMFAKDAAGVDSAGLDYYEVRFNGALAALRVSAERTEGRRRARRGPSIDGPSSSWGTDAKTLDAGLAAEPTQETSAMCTRVAKELETLPHEQREAVMLVYFEGLKAESEDPTEETAATRCGVSGRTIRKRMEDAMKTLEKRLKVRK